MVTANLEPQGPFCHRAPRPVGAVVTDLEALNQVWSPNFTKTICPRPMLEEKGINGGHPCSAHLCHVHSQGQTQSALRLETQEKLSPQAFTTLQLYMCVSFLPLA